MIVLVVLEMHHETPQVAYPNRMKRIHEVNLIAAPLHCRTRDATVLSFAAKLGLD